MSKTCLPQCPPPVDPVAWPGSPWLGLCVLGSCATYQPQPLANAIVAGLVLQMPVGLIVLPALLSLRNRALSSANATTAP